VDGQLRVRRAAGPGPVVLPVVGWLPRVRASVVARGRAGRAIAVTALVCAKEPRLRPAIAGVPCKMGLYAGWPPGAIIYALFCTVAARSQRAPSSSLAAVCGRGQCSRPSSGGGEGGAARLPLSHSATGFLFPCARAVAHWGGFAQFLVEGPVIGGVPRRVAAVGRGGSGSCPSSPAHPRRATSGLARSLRPGSNRSAERALDDPSSSGVIRRPSL